MSRKIAMCAVLTALALIFSYVEVLLPIFAAVPGIKLGLANIVILVALYTMGAGPALTINILRIMLAGFLFGNLFAIAYALSGGLLSFAVMYLLKRTNKFSMVGVSMTGGVVHNAGQLTMASLVVANAKLFIYMPPLLVSGMLTGILMGMIAWLICKRLPAQKGEVHDYR